MKQLVCIRCHRTKRSHRRNPKVCPEYVMGEIEIEQKIRSLKTAQHRMFEKRIAELEALLPKEDLEGMVLNIVHLTQKEEVELRRFSHLTGRSPGGVIRDAVRWAAEQPDFFTHKCFKHA